MTKFRPGMNFLKVNTQLIFGTSQLNKYIYPKKSSIEILKSPKEMKQANLSSRYDKLKVTVKPPLTSQLNGLKNQKLIKFLSKKHNDIDKTYDIMNNINFSLIKNNEARCSEKVVNHIIPK